MISFRKRTNIHLLPIKSGMSNFSKPASVETFYLPVYIFVPLPNCGYITLSFPLISVVAVD